MIHLAPVIKIHIRIIGGQQGHAMGAAPQGHCLADIIRDVTVRYNGGSYGLSVPNCSEVHVT